MKTESIGFNRIFLGGLSLLFLLLSSLNTHAQPLLAPNKWWKVKHEIYPQGVQTIWYRTYSVSNDTAIGSAIYTKITTQDSVVFYVRENSDSVFFLENGNELMLYNFNMQIGDSVSLNSNAFGTYFYKAKTIDSVLHNGVFLKRIMVETNRSHPHKSGVYQLEWIKGIGDNDYGILSLYIADLGFGPGLECVGELNSSIFTGCPLALDKITSADGLQPFYFNGENIVSTRVADYNECVIGLFDLSGKLVYSCESTAKLLSYSASDLPKGLYILKVKGNNVNFTQRIILDLSKRR